MERVVTCEVCRSVLPALLMTGINRGYARVAAAQAAWVLPAPGASACPCLPETSMFHQLLLGA